MNNRYYLRLICAFVIILFPLMAEAQLSGTFTIDPSGTGDYLNMQEAINDLESEGINGAVILQFTSGIHTVNEVVVGYIDGMSSENSLTIRSQSENAEDVTLEGDGEFVVRIHGTATDPVEYVTLKQLTIKNTEGFTVVEVQGSVAEIYISDNRLFGLPTTLNQQARSLIYAYELSGAGLYIERNLMEDNSLGIHTQSASSVNRFQNLHIDGNRISNVRSGNILVNMESAQVTNNRVQVNTNDALQLNAPSGSTLVANNVLVSDISTTVRTTGPTQSVQFYHNTIVALGGGTQNVEALSVTQTTHDLRNNIIFSSGPGKAYSDQNNTSQWSHNNLYTAGPFLAQFGSSNIPENIGFTLADLAAKTGKHQNSFGLFPALDPENDYRSNSPFLDQAGDDLMAIVATDIDGNPRSSSPSIGAFEYTSTVTPFDGGTYTVGNGGDFLSPAAMIDAIHERGLTDDVAFEILPGTYPVGRSLHVVPPATGDERVTIRSQSGNPEDVILEGVADVEQVLNLYGTRFVTIEDLTFDARELTTSSRYALGMNGGVSDITIRGNRILGDEGAFSENRNLIAGTAVYQSNYLFENNDFEGGYYAVRLNSHFGGSLFAENFVFRRNKVESFGGLNVHMFDGGVIEKNLFKADRAIRIDWFNRSPDAETRVLIANNQIASRTEGGNLVYGIWIRTSDAVDLLHNTVRIMKNTASEGAVNINSSSDVDFANNIIAVETPTATNPVYRISGNTSDLRSDHNHFYGLMDNKFRDGSTNYSTLEDFQNGTGFDESSSFGEVTFVSDDELRPGGDSASDSDMVGTNQFLHIINDDILDNLRGNPPFKGAYEPEDSEINSPPVFTSVLGDVTISEGENLEFQFEAEDPDGDPLTFSLAFGGDTDNASITSDGFFSFIPESGQIGEFDFTVRVTDGIFNTNTEFTVTVDEMNEPPFFTVTTEGGTIEVGDTFAYQFEAEDPNDDELTFSISDDTDILNSSITENGFFTFIPDDGQIGQFQFTIVVSDGELTDEHSFTITVEWQVLQRYYVSESGGDDQNSGASWDSSLRSLKEALLRAVEGETDEIWVAAGTYLPTSDETDRSASFELFSGLSLYGGFEGNETSTEQRDPENNPTVLSGQINDSGNNSGNSYTVLMAEEVQDLLIDGFTISGGNANVSENPASQFKGGGLYIGSGNMTVRNSHFTENVSVFYGGAAYIAEDAVVVFDNVLFSSNEGNEGGAVLVEGGEIQVAGSRFENNFSYGGGAIKLFTGSVVSITNTLFSENESFTNGGAIWSVNSDLNIGETEFSQNISGGGTIYSQNTDLDLYRVQFLENSAQFGGAIKSHGSDIFGENLIFERNQSESGGALYSRFNLLEVYVNSLFYGNTASTNGGAVYAFGGEIQNNEVLFVNSLFYDNSSESGGAIYNEEDSDIFVYNTIFSENEASEAGNDLFNLNGELTLAHNLLEDGFGSSQIRVGYTDAGGNISGDPLFRNADAGDFRLVSGSPAINAGTSTPFETEEIAEEVIIDLEGNPRIRYDKIDIGPYEWNWIGGSTIFVKANAIGIETGEGWDNALTDLQRALLTAEVLSSDVISDVWVAAGTYTPTKDTTDRYASFQLKNGVGLYGGFNGTESTIEQRNWKENETILSGDINSTDNFEGNSFSVVNGTNSDSTAVLDGFTITGGFSDVLSSLQYANNPTYVGGGLFIGACTSLTDCHVIVRNTTFIKNRAGTGGAISIFQSPRLTLQNVEIIENETVIPDGVANYGGGLASYYTELILENVLFERNKAIGNIASGGGLSAGVGVEIKLNNGRFVENESIHLQNPVGWGGGASGGRYIEFNNVQFINNFAKSAGGFRGSVTGSMSNVLVEGNSSESDVGGIYITAVDSLVLNNILIKNNSSISGVGGLKLTSSTAQSTVDLINVTVVNNSSEISVGGLIIEGINGLTTNIINSIIWGNNVQDSPIEFFWDTPSPVEIRNSLIKGCYDNGVWNDECGLDAGNNIIDEDPGFRNLDTGDFRLKVESPAIRTGTNEPYESGGSANMFITDLAGNSRIVGGTVDLGVYEFQRSHSSSSRLATRDKSVIDFEEERVQFEIIGIPQNIQLPVFVDLEENEPENARLSEADSLVTLVVNWNITALGNHFEQANITFKDISSIAGADDIENLTLYSRPLPGKGFFTPVENSFYQPETDQFQAIVTGFSEFVFGTGTVAVSVDELFSEIPEQYSLEQNYPNPFNPSTKIQFGLPKPTDVRLEVFDMIGRRVAILVDGTVQAGYHRVEFNASSLASGVYFYRMAAGEEVISRKLTLIK